MRAIAAASVQPAIRGIAAAAGAATGAAAAITCLGLGAGNAAMAWGGAFAGRFAASGIGAGGAEGARLMGAFDWAQPASVMSAANPAPDTNW